MKYTALALLIGAAFGAQAADPVTVYGKINLAIQANDAGGEKTSELVNHHSRIGFKGEQKLTDDLTAVYKYEVRVNMDDDVGSTFSKRNQYVGLRSAKAGEFLIGRKDTAMKSAQGKIDRFGDINGDIAGLFAGENRVDEALHYTSPMFDKIKVTATYILEGNNKQEAAAAAGASDAAFSIAASYGSTKWKDGGIYASVAYDSEVYGRTVLRGLAYGQFGDFQVGAALQHTDDVVANVDGMGYMVNAAYVQGPFTYKAQYQSSDVAANGKGSEGDVINLGVDYKLGKSTTLYGVFTDFTLDDKAHDDNYFGIGMIQLF